MTIPKRNVERYSAGGDLVFHVFEVWPGRWAVRVQQAGTTTGTVIGAGVDRQAAVTEAVARLEAITAILQGPPSSS